LRQLLLEWTQEHKIHPPEGQDTSQPHEESLLALG